MTKVKICGLTRREDIAMVNRALPDYIGFVFAKSPRQVSFAQAAALKEGLDRRIKTVGVFVNEPLFGMVDIAKTCELHAVQLHGDECAYYVKELKKLLPGVEIWKAFRIKNEKTARKISKFEEADFFLLDGYHPDCYGGVGKPFDWAIGARAADKNKIILAGGLCLGNVEAAVKMVRPFAVDVSSGVETDGVKDESKITDFINKVRRIG